MSCRQTRCSTLFRRCSSSSICGWLVKDAVGPAGEDRAWIGKMPARDVALREVRLMGGFSMQEKEMRERRRRKWESREKAAEASRGCNVCNSGPKWMRQTRVVELGSCDSACRVELSARGGTPSPW